MITQPDQLESHLAERAFTRTDLGVVLAVCGLLCLLGTSVLGKMQSGSHRAGCANNLRQLGVAILKYASENGNLPPWYVSRANGGTKTLRFTYQHLSTLSNHVAGPRAMLCPVDPVKRPALDFSTDATGFLGMGNQAAGYAIMTELSMQTPRSILLGDRLISGGEPPSGNCGAIGAPANRFGLSSSSTVVWLPELHDSGIGNLLFADGSVQAKDSQGLRQAYLANPADGNKSGCTLLP